ncbi:phage antirepressor KilAC domain-containing protein [Rhodococcus sp. ACT016]|uniref:phage antirepressor KilAC domain-containing protein n=1 Tax=Rhodococcus sp. ACT016 TaxID=3134808 RepID=UPI003D292898
MRDISLPDEESPFDRIRRVRPDGAEFWTARELMALMGYARWENFMTPVERAMKTAENQNMNADTIFLRSQEKTGGRPREDFELARYAAYLVAMNGDPNIKNVAEAQHYFAIRTREAEVGTVADRGTVPDLSTPAGVLAMAERFTQTARQLVATAARADAAEQQLAVDAPKVEAYEQFMDSTGTYAVGSVAKMIGSSQNKLYADLRACGVFIAGGAMRNTPYQRYMHHFTVKATSYTRSDGTEGTSYTTRVRPSGVDFIRQRAGTIAPSRVNSAADSINERHHH